MISAHTIGYDCWVASSLVLAVCVAAGIFCCAASLLISDRRQSDRVWNWQINTSAVSVGATIWFIPFWIRYAGWPVDVFAVSTVVSMLVFWPALWYRRWRNRRDELGQNPGVSG